MMPFPKPVLIVDENGTPVAPSVPAGVEITGRGPVGGYHPFRH